jgi:RHS repeat-associated protein
MTESRRDGGAADGDPRPAAAPGVTAPSLPAGGGAVRGIGESFGTDPMTGTGSLTVPLGLPPGRGGFGPGLELRYDTGAGDGVFGLGWGLTLPAVSRRTERGLPRYDAGDVFVLGGEELVPGATADVTVHGGGYRVTRFRPRVERDFTLVERWVGGAGTFWRTITRDNVTTWYGRTGASRVADPADDRRVFRWLPCERHDDRGNAVTYTYAAEDGRGVDTATAPERHRTAAGRGAERHLTRVSYGNAAPYHPTLAPDGDWTGPDDVAGQSWLFTVVLDYGDHQSPTAPTPVPDRDWPARADPFSTRRPGFELRTYRLCRRVLTFHSLPRLGADCLVTATELGYDEPTPGDPASSGHSLLVSVTRRGFRRKAAPQTGYDHRAHPPLRLAYSRPVVDRTVRHLDPGEHLPVGLSGAGYRWVDLDGEGLAGVLTEQGGAWHYSRGEGGGRFGSARVVDPLPSLADLSAGRQQLLDLDASGALDLVDLGGTTPGYHRRGDGGWDGLVPFRSLPALDWADEALRFADLTGDGRPDVLTPARDWHPALGAAGYGPALALRPAVPADRADAAPPAAGNAGTAAMLLADLTGDGLPDLVRVERDAVAYWPSLGHGRFGPMVTMADPPVLAAPGAFDPRRVRLADIDGSGPADLIYLGAAGTVLHLNRNGDRWSGPLPLDVTVPAEDLPGVQVADLLGTGTACLVWSSALPAEAPVRYVDLFSDGKPHVLVEVGNSLGGSTEIAYAPSTRFYLDDRRAGRPWATRLPFPVHCVSRVTTRDRWRGTAFSTSYSYHHGYFDPVEREFRGFARVEQVDVEDYGAFPAGSAAGPYVTDDARLFQPPVLTTSWFRTGAAERRRALAAALAAESFPAGWDTGAFRERPVPDAPAPAGMGDVEWRDACRAERGRLARREVYELDVDALAEAVPRRVPVRLFTVEVRGCGVRRLEPAAAGRPAVFQAIDTEAVVYQHDLGLPAARGTVAPDPRIGHTLHLRHDELGVPVESVEAAYGRIGTGLPAPLPAALPAAASIRAAQAATQLACRESRYTGDVEVATAGGAVLHRRLRLPCETRTDVLTTPLAGLPRDAAGYLDRAGLAGQMSTVGREPVSRTRTLYLRDEDGVAQPSAPHPLGTHGPRGLPHDTYRLALTDTLLDTAIGTELLGLRADDAGPTARALLTTAGGYRAGAALFGPADAGTYWAATGSDGMPADAVAGFYLPDRHTDPFGNTTTAGWDPAHLFVRSVTDPAGNTVTAEVDYRVLAATAVTDAGGNRVECAFDLLGGVTATAANGRPAGAGDTLAGLGPTDPDPAAVAAFCVAVTQDDGTARGWLGPASVRYVRHFGEDVDAAGLPVWEARMPAAVTVTRERTGPAPAGGQVPVRVALECSDGGGNVLLQVARAAADPDTGADRWIAGGRVVVNNKGFTVKRHQPVFVDRFGVRLPPDEGACLVTYHDAIGREVRTEAADGSYLRAEFGPWHTTRYDTNDTVLDSDWLARRQPPDVDQPLPVSPVTGAPTVTPEKRAAWLAAQHAGTPAHTVLDARGRQVFSVSHNRFTDDTGAVVEEFGVTRVEPDPRGDPLRVTDARGRVVASSTYDLAGRLLHRRGMDSGERWTVPDAAGRPLLGWDTTTAAGEEVRRLTLATYDGARRPTGRLLRTWRRPPGGAYAAGPAERVERIEYQDGLADDPANLNGQPVRHYDPAGLAELVRRDLHGRVTERRRTPVADPEAEHTDWTTLTTAAGAPKLAGETYTEIAEHDAVGRLTRLLSWHRPGAPVAVLEPSYDAGGALRSEDLVLRATLDAAGAILAGTRTTVLRELGYDAAGRRAYVEHGNGTATDLTYDPDTGRLVQVFTTRPADPRPLGGRHGGLADPRVVQDLTYTYDAAGNVTEVADGAYEPVFFANQVVDPVNRYTYDAMYRLVEATGRENGSWRDGPAATEPTPRSGAFPAADPAALRGYRQRYTYDQVGNLTRLRHGAGAGSWTRDFAVASDDAAAAGGEGDRLWQSWDSGDRATAVTYRHDPHGNLLNPAGPETFRYDHRDLPAGADTAAGTVSYQHTADGTRLRTRLRNADGSGWERLDLGGYQRYRRFATTAAVVEEIETHHVAAGERRVLIVDDVLLTPGAAGTVLRYQYPDRLGSVRLELDGAAAILTYAEDHPYGTAAYRATGAVVEAPPRRYGFVGAARDEATGLLLLGARSYAPWLCRWVSADPDGLRDGTNRYQYVRSNPVRDIDPTGRQTAPAEEKSSWDQALENYGAYLVDLDDRQIAWDREAERLGNQWNEMEGHTTDFGKWIWSQYRKSYVTSVIGQRPYNELWKVVWFLGKALAWMMLGGFRGSPSPTPARLIHMTNAPLEDIALSGRLVGRTEGSVYAAEEGAAWTGAGKRANTIVFEGEAVNVFQRHPVFGMWSLAKRLGGQFKAGIGDVELLDAQLVNGVLRVRSARLVEGLQAPFVSYTRLWGSHVFLDVGLTSLAGFAGWLYTGSGQDWLRSLFLSQAVEGPAPDTTPLPPGSTGYLEHTAPRRFRLMEPTP